MKRRKDRGDAALEASYLERMARLLEGPRRELRRFDQAVRHDIDAARHTLSYVRHLARGNRIRQKALFERLDEKRPPVLLIHGYLGTRGAMYILEERLTNDGHCVFSFNLGSLNVRDIRASAYLIHRKIESILAQTTVKHIDIVGHSMGGLIGLYYVKKLGGHRRVRRLVMMGTPMRGTWSALFGVMTMGLVSSSPWQLLPGSRFLKELAEGPLPQAVDYLTIAAERDWLCPIGSTPLDGVEALRVPLGHSSLVMSEEVYRHLHFALKR